MRETEFANVREFNTCHLNKRPEGDVIVSLKVNRRIKWANYRVPLLYKANSDEITRRSHSRTRTLSIPKKGTQLLGG